MPSHKSPAQFQRQQELYLEWMAKQLGIRETYEMFLASGFEATNIRRFLVVAFHLMCAARKVKDTSWAMRRRVISQRVELQWHRVLRSLVDSVEEEIRYDGPNVMNMIGVLHSIKENKRQIVSVARKLPKLIDAAAQKDAIEGVMIHGKFTPEDLFCDFAEIPPSVRRWSQAA